MPRIAPAILLFALFPVTAITPAPPASAHWYVIAPFDFYQHKEDAEPWMRKIRKRILEDTQPQHCELGDKAYSNLVQEERSDANMEIVRIHPRDDGGRKIHLVISVSSESESRDIAYPNCGTPVAEDCIEGAWGVIANDIIQHDHQCHRGNKCSELP